MRRQDFVIDKAFNVPIRTAVSDPLPTSIALSVDDIFDLLPAKKVSKIQDSDERKKQDATRSERWISILE